MNEYDYETEERSITDAEMQRDLDDAEWSDRSEAVGDWLDVAERAWRDTLTPADVAALAEEERIEREMDKRRAAWEARWAMQVERGREMMVEQEAQRRLSL